MTFHEFPWKLDISNGFDFPWKLDISTGFNPDFLREFPWISHGPCDPSAVNSALRPSPRGQDHGRDRLQLGLADADG